MFAFHLDTRNAARIAPPEARTVAVEGRFPVARGDVVTLRLRPVPFAPVSVWRVRVAELVEPTLLVDVAEQGPFRSWRHEHRFDALDHGRTLMTDLVEYAPPLGAVGGLGDRLLGRRALGRIFRIRQQRTREILEGEGRP